MTIIIQNKKQTFEEIAVGDLFISTKHSANDEEQIYMKAEGIEDTYGAVANAINLHTGRICSFYVNDRIELVTATLNIKRG